jgi:hypothetical protein
MFLLRKASRQGFVAVRPLDLISWKIGVSWSDRRM